MTLIEVDGKMMTPQERNVYYAKLIEKEFGCWPDESKLTKEERKRFLELYFEMQEC